MSSCCRLIKLFNRHLFEHLFCSKWASHGAGGKEATCQCRRHKKCRFDPLVGKIPWRRKWQPTPVFLPGEPQGQTSLEATVQRVAKSRTRLKRLKTAQHTYIYMPISKLLGSARHKGHRVYDSIYMKCAE